LAHLHFVTLVVGLTTGGGLFSTRLASDVPTDSGVFNAITSTSRKAVGDPVEGVADFRIGSCRRQVTDDREGDDASQQWLCRLSYTYARVGSCGRPSPTEQAADSSCPVVFKYAAPAPCVPDKNGKWSCSDTYRYARAEARETVSRTVLLLGLHHDSMTATSCLDCGPPLHFMAGLDDRMDGKQFVHTPSGPAGGAK
jgi:hypothetical protein